MDHLIRDVALICQPKVVMKNIHLEKKLRVTNTKVNNF